MLLAHSIRRRRKLTVLATALAIGVTAVRADAATATELLEQGIYAEETVGNLDEAIKIYEKVVAEGKTARSAAAQAQFRIGLCHAKQGNDKEATAAFQAVVDNFPAETDVVAQAKSRLPGEPQLLPAPWKDGEELRLEMALPTGMPVGLQIYRIAKTKHDGRDAWECQAWQTVTLNGASGKSRVLVDAEDFAPIESYWKHSMLGEATAHYGKNEIKIDLAGKDEPVIIKRDGPVFDNEQGAEMFRRLPLKVGFKAEPTIISTLTATEVPLGIEVTKLETIKVPAGEFECFRLELAIGQTFWISTDEHRYVVRFAAGGVTADLTEIRHRQADEGIKLDRDGYTLELPPNWYAYTPSNEKDEDLVTTQLIDPDAALNARIESGAIDWVRSKYKSPAGWLEHALGEYRERMKDFQLRDEGVEKTTVGEREAAVATFEYSDDKKPMIARRITVFGERSAANLRFTTSAEEFDKWEPVFNEMLKSLKVE